MIYEVEFSEQADKDFTGIFEYIAFELQSPENASGQLDRLEEQILSLDIFQNGIENNKINQGKVVEILYFH